MIDPRIQLFVTQADAVQQYLHGEFSKLQTGRANAALVEHINVDAYGQMMQVKALASISVQDSRSIVVQPWDKSMLQPLEKAISQSNIGVSPVNDGSVLRLNLPPMTEERRKQMVKIVQGISEEARISIRKHRQDSHDQIKEEKDEDVKRTLLEELQKSVDAANGKIDEARKKKEEEIAA